MINVEVTYIGGGNKINQRENQKDPIWIDYIILICYIQILNPLLTHYVYVVLWMNCFDLSMWGYIVWTYNVMSCSKPISGLKERKREREGERERERERSIYVWEREGEKERVIDI